MFAALLALAGAVGAAEPAEQPGQSSSSESSPPAPASASSPAETNPGSTQAVPAARQADNVAIITIEGQIDRWTAMSVERRLKRAEEAGADAVVFEIDTPGGAVGAVLEICNLIKGSSIANTVAWINQDAYSGGAIIALACREIVVTDYASMGDAAPIQVSPFGLQEMGETERQKILAPLMAEVVDSARRHGYDEKLVQGFLTLGVELWWVENKETGEQLFVDAGEYGVLFGEEPPRGSARFSSGAGSTAASGSTDSAPSDALEEDFQPASPELGEELQKTVNDSLATRSSRPQITAEDRGQWRLLEYTTDGSTLLTLKSEDLKRYGFASETINDDAELKKFLGADNLRRLGRSWSESLARFLASLPVRGLLIVVFLLALFMEMASPGLGLAGAVSLGCLAGLVAPQFLVGASAWWEIAAVVAGMLLVAFELFVIPGFGIFGIAGVALLFGGLLGIVVGPGGLFPETPRERQDLLYGVATLMLAIFTAGVGMYFLAKQYTSLPMLNRLVLQNTSPDENDQPTMLGAMRPPEEQSAVKAGDVGEAITPLRPAGRAEFGDHLLDVVCEMGFIPQGAKVRVVEVGRFRTVVERVEEESSSPPSTEEGSNA